MMQSCVGSFSGFCEAMRVVQDVCYGEMQYMSFYYLSWLLSVLSPTDTELQAFK